MLNHPEHMEQGSFRIIQVRGGQPRSFMSHWYVVPSHNWIHNICIFISFHLLCSRDHTFLFPSTSAIFDFDLSIIFFPRYFLLFPVCSFLSFPSFLLPAFLTLLTIPLVYFWWLPSSLSFLFLCVIDVFYTAAWLQVSRLWTICSSAQRNSLSCIPVWYVTRGIRNMSQTADSSVF